MPTTEQNERIATLEANYKNTDERIADLSHAVRELSKEVRTLASSMSEAKGGWKMLMALSSFSGMLGAAATWVLTHLSFKVGG